MFVTVVQLLRLFLYVNMDNNRLDEMQLGVQILDGNGNNPLIEETTCQQMCNIVSS